MTVFIEVCIRCVAYSFLGWSCAVTEFN